MTLALRRGTYHNHESFERDGADRRGASLCGRVWRTAATRVATGGGAFAVLTPLVFVILVPTWVVISKATKTAALASLAVLCAIPVGVWVTGRELWEIPASIGIALLIALRHASNIRRMRSGSELSL